MLRVNVLRLLLLLSPVAASAIENLNCDLDLRAEIEIAPGTKTRIGRNDIVIRGPLEINLQLSPVLRLSYAIRDAEGFERIFPRRDDSLHLLAPGDRIFLIGRNGKLFMNGYYNHVLQPTEVDWTGEFQTLMLPQPQLFEDRQYKVPRLTIDRFREFFTTNRQAVVVKSLDDEVLTRMRAHLNPQIERYRTHLRNPSRIIDIAPNREPYEMRVFDLRFEGHLRDEYVDFPKRIKHGAYPMSLRLWRDQPALPVRSGDRLFVLDAEGRLLKEFQVSEYPVMVRMAAGEEDVHQLLEAIGYEGRTILIRPVGRSEER